jgi:ABC-type branched-subunit amino acid transport system ATPase component
MGLGYVPQLRCVFPRLSVAENLEMGAYVLRSAERERSIKDAFERFPVLAAVRHRRAGVLSGGEQRLLGVARAWVAHPRVLLLDEPTSALSPKATEQLWKVLGGLADDGVALLVVEQRTRRTLQISGHAYVLASGKNVVDGPPSELQERYDLGAIFMGQPAIARQDQASGEKRERERVEGKSR